MLNKRKLKIAIFHLAFIYSGGGEKLVLQEYDGLKRRGHKVQIFTTVINKKKSFPDIIKKYKIKEFLPNWKIFDNHEAFKTILSCVLVPFYASKFKDFDAILACNQPSVWIAYLIRFFYNIPYVTYIAQPTRFLHPRKIDREMGLFFAKKASESVSARLMMTTFRRFSNWADGVSIRASNKVLVNGVYMKSVIEKVYKVDTINCPSGVKSINGSKISKGNYLLVTNRHFPQKRIEYSIFVLNTVLTLRPNYRLVITGMDTNYTRDLKKLVNELGIKNRVDFMGYVDEKKLKNLYLRANCYLYTAPEEDFGMGVIEAMSNGTPVIAWNAKGPSRIITNGIDGLLAKPYDIADFSKLTERVIMNSKFSAKIVKNALTKINTSFSAENHIDTIENTLNLLILDKDEKVL